ncbi:hypothetical protein DY037_05255 [Apilactobacillus micheneri]|uniref:hypothetical protein n=1 Tax=Apilactobacillus micheneri TaxID=1899430 RepID=UPI00112BEAA9|nr:hypothetical protein [Apilactobacillus micheneri]TPR49187.1 hypothetical protein DY037_05255 [Apilactobacillus micheneri]
MNDDDELNVENIKIKMNKAEQIWTLLIVMSTLFLSTSWSFVLISFVLIFLEPLINDFYIRKYKTVKNINKLKMRYKVKLYSIISYFVSIIVSFVVYFVFKNASYARIIFIALCVIFKMMIIIWNFKQDLRDGF